ncbi:sel1 repeat family protein [Massilia solisilvae]|uniref:Sel1 repeat family protein n=1 Tax=Massilia solisilvae TaxID=1811225 RepID=A0ABT2BJ15_9BURK|nr:tetratricopeptide repeat protein [Massilia solisilvae]MCS0607908.1 sel1 repeat family protein [Massilia solisilvae]
MRIRTGLLLAACSLQLALAGCAGKPSAAQIELLAMGASQRGDYQAEQRLANWASQGLPVAQRELALLYRNRPEMAEAAVGLLRQAAQSGDAEAAFQMGELERSRNGLDMAAQWYRAAGATGHPKAALALALMYKNGNGVALDKHQAIRWLEVAANGGNAHAMFLLSNVYADGDGVPADPKKARQLLERSADLEYPAAIQQLALVKQTGDSLTARDSAEAAALLQEAAEHRKSNARRF